VSFLLDTDICSFHLRGDPRLQGRLQQHMGQLAISATSVAELMVWSQRRTAPMSRQVALESLLRDITIHDVDLVVARKYGELRAAQLDTGTPSPQFDLVIAATAIVHGRILVTHNVSEFFRDSSASGR
jgi:tRNA(fMet)-specific endonuclease VapC